MNLLGSARRKVRNVGSFRRAARDARAKTPGLNTRVSRNDRMMERSQPDQYFVAGQAGFEAIQRGLDAAGIVTAQTILDLPCGHGRVLRYLRARWPQANLTDCEIVPDAVSFCAETFGADGLVSRDPLWDVDLGGPYDLIWSGSLFTHFDAPYWVPSLAQLGGALSEDGVLVFSSQGKPSLAFLKGSPDQPVLRAVLPRDYGLTRERAETIVASAEATGFGFAHYSSGDDHPYGVSVSLPAWVAARLAEVNLRVVLHETGGWGGHQDMWTVAAART